MILPDREDRKPKIEYDVTGKSVMPKKLNFLNINMQSYDCHVLEKLMAAKSEEKDENEAFDIVIVQTNVHFPPPVKYRFNLIVSRGKEAHRSNLP